MGVMEQILEELQEINNKLDNLPAGSKQDPEMMNIEQAADFLTMSDTKVREEIKQGNIPCVKYGRRKVIPKWKLIEKINGKFDKKESVEQLENVQALRR